MWRVSPAVAGVAVSVGLAIAAPWTLASADDQALTLTATADEVGWVSLAARGPDGGQVDVREDSDGRSATVARLSLRDGIAERRHAVRWRCKQRTRSFTATTHGPGAQTATATITTPSCDKRLRMIVVPASVRPGQAANVRVTDTWRFGRVTATVCAWLRSERRHCTPVVLRRGARTRRARLRPGSPGRWTIGMRSAFGQRLTAPVVVRDGARLRVLVAGDSMIFGLYEALGGDLGTRATVHGDAQPGRGITTPGSFYWPTHARRSARNGRPDVTVVFLGAADAGYPLTTPAGETVQCCEPAWVAAYARRVTAMTTAYLRDGRGLVYWVLQPAPRSAVKGKVARASNDAVRLAGRGFDDGVRVIERVADILAPHDTFRKAIRLHGRLRVVRDEDGVHLTAPGIRVATNVIRDTLLRDGLVQRAGR